MITELPEHSLGLLDNWHRSKSHKRALAWFKLCPQNVFHVKELHEVKPWEEKEKKTPFDHIRQSLAGIQSWWSRKSVKKNRVNVDWIYTIEVHTLPTEHSWYKMGVNARGLVRSINVEDHPEHLINNQNMQDIRTYRYPVCNNATDEIKR